MESMPKKIKAGDNRVLLGGQPPLVDCRVISEELYREMRDIWIKNKFKIEKYGRCESYQCSSVESGRCTRIGKAVITLKGTTKNDSLNDEHFKSHLCEEAISIDELNGFETKYIY